MKIYTKNQLEQFQNVPLLIDRLEEGFIKYSQKSALVPPVGHMGFANPPGDLHIKSAAIPGGNYFVLKVAGHFPENNLQGMPALNGLMIVFSRRPENPKLCSWTKAT